jgi:lysozyme
MINKATEILTKSFETLRLKAYKDSADILTIGWGHTSDNNFTIKPNSIITEIDAEELFLLDMSEAENIVKKQLPEWQYLNENQYGACTDFAFNRGTLKWKSGKRTLIYECLLNRNYKDAAQEFLSFTKDVAGNILKGLLRRRFAEKLLFETIPYNDSIIKDIINLTVDLQPADLDLPHNLADEVFEMNFVNIPIKPELSL